MTAASKRTRAGLTTTVVALAMVALALPPMPRAEAQQGPAIAFLNPTPLPPLDTRPIDEPIVSDRNAAGDSTYRLSAWVANPPANSIVEFELDDTIGGTQTLAPTRRVSPDTWEYQWNISGIGNDPFTYILRAILFDGDTLSEVARHEIDVIILADPDAGHARVEMVLPQNGGEAGFYRPPGENQPANSITRFVRTSDTGWVRPFYTLTRPGESPVWNTCSGYVNASSGVSRCTLDASHDPLQVTAIRLMANSSSNARSELRTQESDTTTDAIRVVPYVQQPTDLIITRAVTAAADDCSSDFVTTLTDQIGRAIAAANIDVHAVGPTDQLRFDTRSGVNLRGRPPEQGNHTTQIGFNCSSGGRGDPQGLHRRPGVADIKHLQSLPGGTSNTGTFSLALFSPDPGTTQISSWVDLDGNDVWTVGEPCAASAVGFGADRPPTVEPEFVECSTGSPAPPPTLPPSDVTFQDDEVTGVKGDTVTLTAFVTNEEGSPVNDEPVTWVVEGVGEVVSQDETTDSAGRAMIRLTSESEGEQTVDVSTQRCTQDGTCSDSARVTWMEQPDEFVIRAVGLRRLTQATSSTLQAKGRVRGGGRPRCAKGVPVNIQRFDGGRWVKISQTMTGNDRFYQTRFEDRAGRYRAVAPRVVRTGAAGQRLICRRAVSEVRRA